MKTKWIMDSGMENLINTDFVERIYLDVRGEEHQYRYRIIAEGENLDYVLEYFEDEEEARTFLENLYKDFCL